MTDFSFSSPTKIVAAEPDICSDREEEFHGEKGSHLRTANPLAKAALQHLGSVWPKALHFEELLTESLKFLGREKESEDAIMLGAILQSSFGVGLVDVHVHPPQLVLQPGEHPCVSPVARMQAARGDLVTTLRHRTVRLGDALSRQLVQLLDGSRNLATLTSQLRQTVEQMKSGGGAEEGRGIVISAGETGEREVESMLLGLARLGLLFQ